MIITKEEFVRNLAQTTGYTQKSIRDLFSDMDEVLLELLSKATDGDDVDVRISHCIGVTSRFYPSTEVTDPRNGEKVMSKPKIRTSAKVYGRMKRI